MATDALESMESRTQGICYAKLRNQPSGTEHTDGTKSRSMMISVLILHINVLSILDAESIVGDDVKSSNPGK